MFQDFIEILILSAIQGISEFLPISSSAHLILISNFYDFKTSSLLIDISLHLGSLFAIMFYFKKDLFDLKNNKRLLGLIIVGSIPLMIFGYILHSSDLIYFVRNVEIIAWTTLFFGLTDEEDFILTVVNESGEVALEQVGREPAKILAPSLAVFIEQLTPAI